MFGFAGAIALSPPAVGENEGRLMRWFILKPWVTEESAIKFTFVMSFASGVATKNESP